MILESALWSAVRALEEQMMLAQRIVVRARKGNHNRAVQLFEQRARDAEARSSAQLCLKSQFSTASPPDVRRGFASPVVDQKCWGFAPRPGFAQNSLGQRPYEGHSPPFVVSVGGRSPAAHQVAKPPQKDF